MIKLPVNETKWSCLLTRTRALILYISIWIFDFGPVKLPGLSRNGPLENKFLENKSGRIFCVRRVYFTKSWQQIWGRVNQPFILFMHHIWGETVPWGAVFIIQTSDRMQYFAILRYKLHSFNIQDDRSTRGLLAKPLKKISKITNTASRFSLLTSAKVHCLN